MRLRSNLRLLALLTLPHLSARQRERRGVGLGQAVCSSAKSLHFSLQNNIWHIGICYYSCKWMDNLEGIWQYGPRAQLCHSMVRPLRLLFVGGCKLSFSAFNFFLVSKSLLAAQGSLFCHSTICRGEKLSVSYISWWAQRSFPYHLQAFQDRDLHVPCKS